MSIAQFTLRGAQIVELSLDPQEARESLYDLVAIQPDPQAKNFIQRKVDEGHESGEAVTTVVWRKRETAIDERLSASVRWSVASKPV